VLKGSGTVNLNIDQSRLPYIAQTIGAAIDDVMLVASVKNNPATFTVDIDGAPVNLSRVDEWKLCRGVTAGIALGTPFAFSVAAGQLSNLDELMLVVKYSF
jgi:hypothetical protein